MVFLILKAKIRQSPCYEISIYKKRLNRVKIIRRINIVEHPHLKSPIKNRECGPVCYGGLRLAFTNAFVNAFANAFQYWLRGSFEIAFINAFMNGFD